MSVVAELLTRARAATTPLRLASTEQRNRALDAIARGIAENRAAILAANTRDLAAARELNEALRDRLKLDDKRVDGMIRAVEEIRALPDPLAGKRELPAGRSGIAIEKRRVPLGVIGIVFEARPNVSIECSALTIKSGNAVVLRGGREALESNLALVGIVRAALVEAGLPVDAVSLVSDPAREHVVELLSASGQVDLVIPRGGKALMALVDREARVPVIRHGEGICHVYVHAAADLPMAEAIALNAKVHRPGVCNAMETLLVDRAVLEPVLAGLGPKLAAAGVELRADADSLAVLSRAGVAATAAKDVDFDTEFLALVLAIRTVGGLDAALSHIEAHGSRHTAAIVTNDAAAAERFLDAVDASCVLWNASTRFNDGGELGFGAEMGISTSKLHVYGPMALVELTAEKIVVHGQGHVRS